MTGDREQAWGEHAAKVITPYRWTSPRDPDAEARGRLYRRGFDAGWDAATAQQAGVPDRVTFDADGTLDEVVMSGAFVHLEHLDTTRLGRKTYMLIVENGAEHVHLTIDRARAVFVYERFTPGGEQAHE